MAKKRRDPSVPPPLREGREAPRRRQRRNPPGGMPGIPGLDLKRVGQFLGLPESPKAEDWLFGLGRMVQTMREAGEQRRARRGDRPEDDDDVYVEGDDDDEC